MAQDTFVIYLQTAFKQNDEAHQTHQALYLPNRIYTCVNTHLALALLSQRALIWPNPYHDGPLSFSRVILQCETRFVFG